MDPVLDLVWYCPGEAPGAPAVVFPWEVERYLGEDVAFLVARHGGPREAQRAVQSWPHVGGACACCRPTEPQTSGICRGCAHG